MIRVRDETECMAIGVRARDERLEAGTPKQVISKMLDHSLNCCDAAMPVPSMPAHTVMKVYAI